MTSIIQHFYLLFDGYRPDAKSRVELLCDAASRSGVVPISLDRRTFDFSKWETLNVRPTDMFYNATPFTHELERVFINSRATGFHTSRPIANHIASSTQINVALLSAGMPMPRTIVEGTNNRDLLRRYVDHLGGFPLVVKVVGGSRGVGAIMVDSWHGLISLSDFLHSERHEFMLSQFIPNHGAIRAIVVGEDVVCAVVRENPADDFRCSSPTQKPIVKNIAVTDELRQLAVAASKAVQYEFTGIDIIQDNEGKSFVLEVNYPQDFVTPQRFTQVDIALAAVAYLKNKAAKFA